MPFCPKCGKEVAAAANFCMACGFNLVEMPPSAPVPSPAGASPSGSERVLCTVPVLKKPKSLGRWDTYNLAVTGQRLIFALFTADMVKRAVADAQQQAKAEGKGLLQQMAAQMTAGKVYAQRYMGMNPDDILREQPGNFAIDNATVTRIKLREKRENDPYVTYEFRLDTTSGKYAFETDSYPDDVGVLQQLFGGKVKAEGKSFAIRFKI